MYNLHLAPTANRSSISTDYSETASFVSTAPSNASSVVVGEFSALCLHDYEPTDPDQLGFSQGDILAILKTEDTGWWAAAMGNRIGWVPRGYVEPLSEARADTLKSVRRELRLTDIYGTTADSTPSPRESSDVVRGEDSWSNNRRGSGTSSRTQSSEDTRQASSSRPTATPNGTGGYYIDYGGYRSSAPSIGSAQSARGPVPVPIVGSRSQTSLYSLRQILPQEYQLPMSPSERTRTLAVSSGRRGSKDDDAQAHRNAKTAVAALPPHLQPDYGEGYLRLDSEGVVKSGTLEALVERLTVDSLRRSQETAYRTTFLMTYKTFTDALTVFELLNERYCMDPPRSLTEEQLVEWKEKRLRPTQTRVLATLMEWVERYRFVKDESHLVPNLKQFLNLITEPPKNALTAKQLLQMVEKHEAAIAASLAQQTTPSSSSPPSSSTSVNIPPKRVLKLPLPSSKTKPWKNELLKLDTLEVAQHLTLVEYRLYAKIRPAECMYWPKMQKGSEVENLLRFCTTSDRLVAWVKYSILKEDLLGKRADLIEFWIKVAEKCRSLNNISSMTALVAALASSVITRLTSTWAHARGSHIEPLTRLTDPSNNFLAYRTFYTNVDTSCVPFIGIYLTQLVHHADQYGEYVRVPLPAQTPTSVSPTPVVSSSPSSQSSLASSGSSPLTQTSSRHHSSVKTITHINFTRLFKCAEVIHQMLRHQVKGYRQANPSASAPHPVPDPSQALGISLGAENAQVMTFVESMLNTGGVGLTPPPGLPLANPITDGAPPLAGPVGAAEAWYWHRSSELQTFEADASDLRRGMDASGF